ncbi:MAG: hypothetical protein E6J91_23850 [Deltaproteobacteria bacterium]|nr:MAG: hypothetical protein E6J91_23850 [Deltaproteobacteria bacterium]
MARHGAGTIDDPLDRDRVARAQRGGRGGVGLAPRAAARCRTVARAGARGGASRPGGAAGAPRGGGPGRQLDRARRVVGAARSARLDDVVALDPRTVFVLVGINDLLAGAAPEALAARHVALVAELRRRLPRARIVVESLLPIRDELVAREAALTSATVRGANALLERGATAAGAEWLDVAAGLADATGELDRRYAGDGVHLSAAGYRAWAAILRAHL